MIWYVRLRRPEPDSRNGTLLSSETENFSFRPLLHRSDSGAFDHYPSMSRPPWECVSNRWYTQTQMLRTRPMPSTAKLYVERSSMQFMYIAHHTLDARMWTNNFRRWGKSKYEMCFFLCAADENLKWLQVGNANIDGDYFNVLPTEWRLIPAQKLYALIFMLHSLCDRRYSPDRCLHVWVK